MLENNIAPNHIYIKKNDYAFLPKTNFFFCEKSDFFSSKAKLNLAREVLIKYVKY